MEKNKTNNTNVSQFVSVADMIDNRGLEQTTVWNLMKKSTVNAEKMTAKKQYFITVELLNKLTDKQYTNFTAYSADICGSLSDTFTKISDGIDDGEKIVLIQFPNGVKKIYVADFTEEAYTWKKAEFKIHIIDCDKLQKAIDALVDNLKKQTAEKTDGKKSNDGKKTNPQKTDGKKQEKKNEVA